MTEHTVLNSSWGGMISCPANAVISATCGSGRNPNCFKDQKYYASAIRCDTLDGSYISGQPATAVVDDNITGAVCKDSEVAVAACLSGSEANCAHGARSIVMCQPLVANAWRTGEAPNWSGEYMGKWWGSGEPFGGYWKGGPVSTAGDRPTTNVALCKPNYVANGFCNSGENWSDCSSRNSEVGAALDAHYSWGNPFTYVRCGALKQTQAAMLQSLT